MMTGNNKFKYTEENPLRVFTAFSGYDSQCMALDRIGIPYTLVGWSEIDKNAIMAHNAVYPQYADRNYGDIQHIDWKQAQETLQQHEPINEPITSSTYPLNLPPQLQRIGCRKNCINKAMQ